MEIILADITCDTLSKDLYTLDIKTKIKFLQSCLEKLHAYLTKNGNYAFKQEFVAIITAPEYFFAKDHQSERQYDEHEARSIEKSLAQLSAHYKKILIIPGTIAWKKNVLPKKENKYQENSSAYQTLYSAEKMNEKDYLDDKRSRGINKNKDDYLKYTKKSGDHSLLSIKEALFSYGKKNRGGHTQNDFETKIKSLSQDENKLKSILLSRNTLYMYLDGTRLHKYHKRSDYQEVLNNVTKNVFIQGDRKPIATISGIRIGMEICLDHNIGTLKQVIDKHQGFLLEEDKDPVDLHLILSAFVASKPEHYTAKQNGYIIHSSSSFSYRQYLHNKPNNIKYYIGLVPANTTIIPKQLKQDVIYLQKIDDIVFAYWLKNSQLAHRTIELTTNELNWLEFSTLTSVKIIARSSNEDLINKITTLCDRHLIEINTSKDENINVARLIF